ncbi:MAG: PKD domain-containing protein, partial [Bacteroidota bacterium]
AITYAVGGSGTGGSVSGLPAGVSGSFAGGVITITGTPTVSGIFNYTVATTGPCGIPTANGTITITPDATITLTSAPSTTAQELCYNTPLTNITYAVGGSGSGATASGLPAGVTGVYSGGNFTISGTPLASGIFNYTISTTGICAQATATGTITVNALPTSNFNFTAPSCETRTINFTDISIPNSGNIISWAWNFGDPASGPANTSALQNPSHTFATGGTYNVILVVTTDKGCISLAPSRQVVINSRPLAGYIIPQVCLSDTYAQFTDTSKVATPDIISAWDWNFGDPPSGPANTSTLQNPQHSYTATGSYNVQLIATSNKGCKDTLVQVLFVNGSFPQADFTVNNPVTLCANDSVSIVEASTVFPGSITKVEIYWDNVGQPGVFITDNFPVTGKIYKHLYPNFQAPLTRNFTIRYRAYSGGVCVNDKFRTLIVNAAPKVQFNNIPGICLDASPYQITQASEIGGVPGSGVFSGPGVTPGGLFTPSAVGPGTYIIRYTYTSSAGGCIDTLSNTITVYAPPTADFGFVSPFCETKAITFTDNSNTPVGSLTTWTWDFGDGSPLVVRNTGSSFTHTFSSYGTYQVKLSVRTSNGCISVQKIIPVTVNPQPKPNFTTPASACLPDASVSFGNLSTIADGSQGSFTYLWNFGDPSSGSNISTLANPSHIYTATGPFNVNLQITSNNGCVHDTTIILSTIHPQPLASFTVDKIDVCIGGSFAFNNTSNPLDGTTTQLNWVMDDGNLNNTPAFIYTYSRTGTYNVSLFIFNSNGCRSTTAIKTVFVNPYPPVNAGPDKFMLEGGQVTLTPALNANMIVTYSWTPVLYLNNPNIASPVASPPDDFTYTLTVTTDKGCKGSDDVFIKVLKAPSIPNIFSPNGDGVHDKWVIQYLESYPGSTVDIFNRYGQLIYHSEGYTNPWDGTIKGNPVPIGTYYYIINPKNGRKQISGYVDVIR